MKTETPEFCCTCLKSDLQLNNINQFDSENVDFVTKLRFCVPEVEWGVGHICTECSKNLNFCYTFKEQCLRSSEIVSSKKLYETAKQENSESFVNDRDVSDDESYSVTVKERISDEEDETENQEKQTETSVEEFSETNDSETPESGSFQCSLCDNFYSDRNLYFLHKKNTHKEELPYDCLYCEKSFKFHRELKRHEPVHSDQKGHVCEICLQSYHTSSILSKHKIIKHTKPDKWKYVCPHCPKKYPLKSNLDQHIRCHHTNAGDTYICFHCNENFYTRILLISHIRSKHTPGNPYGVKECNLCQKMYINQMVLENHMRKEHNKGTTKLNQKKKKYPCEKCGKKYTTIKILNVHSRACDGVKRHLVKSVKTENRSENVVRKEEKVKSKVTYLTCEFCNKIVGPYKRYVAHCVEEHASDPETLKPYRCKECSERFTTSTFLSRHKAVRHKGSRSHMCSFCGKGFLTRKDMLIHEKLHSSLREYQCELCSKRFHTKSYLRSHKLVVHTDPMLWKHVCRFCGKRFPMKSNHDHHVRRHTGEKPFGCHLCDKRFADKFVLTQHFNSHTNVRAFKCDHCGKEYKSARVLGIHLKKEHDIGNYKVPVRPKKFVCEYCSKSFAANDKLKRHMCSHTGERPYACHICNKRFTDKSYVKQHLKSVHDLQEFKQE